MFSLTVGTAASKGIMFLNEVVLGKEHSITLDNPSLKSAPKGFDSVIARGCTEPGKLLYSFKSPHTEL